MYYVLGFFSLFFFWPSLGPPPKETDCYNNVYFFLRNVCGITQRMMYLGLTEKWVTVLLLNLCLFATFRDSFYYAFYKLFMQDLLISNLFSRLRGMHPGSLKEFPTCWCTLAHWPPPTCSFYMWPIYILSVRTKTFVLTNCSVGITYELYLFFSQ